MWVILWRYKGAPVWRLYLSEDLYYSKESVSHDVTTLNAHHDDREYIGKKLSGREVS